MNELFAPGELIWLGSSQNRGIYQYLGPDPIYNDYHNVIQLRTAQGVWRTEVPRLPVGVTASFLSTMMTLVEQ